MTALANQIDVHESSHWQDDQPVVESPAMLIGYSSFEWKHDPVIRAADGTTVKITEAVFKF